MTFNSIYGNFGVPTPAPTTEAQQTALEEAQAQDQYMNGLSAVFASVIHSFTCKRLLIDLIALS